MENKRWYAWVIRRNRFSNVISHIRTNIPEVDKFFYPQIKKVYKNSRGSRVKEVPLYEGYLFLHYSDDVEVYQRLNAYPFITTFAGEVSEKEIAHMEATQGKLLSEIRASKFEEGDAVIVLSGPFKGFEAEVREVVADQIKVRIDANLLGQQGIELFFEEDKIERKADLQDTSVQEL